MNRKLMKVLILIAYSIPYGYLAMKGDASSGTMIFYGFMIVALGVLCGIIIKTNNTMILFIGNILSFISSYILTIKTCQLKNGVGTLNHLLHLVF